MKLYAIEIDGRRYVGAYRSPADAVFGAMRKDENEEGARMRAEDVPWPERQKLHEAAWVSVEVLEHGPRLSFRGKARKVTP